MWRQLTCRQKCSGDRPSCTRCTAGGWQCVYAPRQRRRTVPKEQKLAAATLDAGRGQNIASLASTPLHSGKKRKLGQRDSQGFGSEGIDMKTAMGMAMELGLAGEEEGEDLMTMSDDQMVR